MQTAFSQSLDLRAPIVMAPMFLVSNESMMREGMRSGIAATFPTLNYRSGNDLEQVLQRLMSLNKSTYTGTLGVNLIVQETNIFYKKHLEICKLAKVPFYITSLGNPRQVIEEVKPDGARVYCDVTNMQHAQKAAAVGCDGFIAIGQGAGGHAGPYPLSVLVPALKNAFPDKHVIAAGGIANGSSILSALAAGADAVSIGTRFIACSEAAVSREYKKAVVDAGMQDIVLTERLSGTPCNIINTDYAKKIGYKQNFIERWLNANKQTKKYFKTLVQYRGVKKLEQAILPGNYQSLWSAGQSVELIHDILPCATIIENLISETEQEFLKLKTNFT